MDDIPSHDDTFRPGARRRKVVSAIAAVTTATLTLVVVLGYAAFMPRLGPDAPDEYDRTAPTFELPSPPAPARMTVTTALPEGIPDGARTVARQTVVVENAFGNHGSGFMLRPGVLLTAAHIADKQDREDKKLRVRCGPVDTDATLLVVDDLRDVIVAQVDCVASPLKIDRGAYRDGAGLFLSGFTFGPDSAVRFFEPTAALADAAFDPANDQMKRRLDKARAAGAAPLQGFDRVVIPGNSGSPVFTSDGAIVGMVVIIDGAHARSFMVPAVNLLATLDAAHVRR